MGVAPLHWELRKKIPDFMILPQNSLNYHKKSSDTLGNEVHTQQQPATRVIWHMRAQRISCRTSYLQKTGVLSNLTHFRFGNKNHTHHRKRLIFLSNLS